MVIKSQHLSPGKDVMASSHVRRVSSQSTSCISNGVVQTSQRKRFLGEFSICEFMTYLQAVDTESDLAKLNETTLDDNNGGRIKY